LLTLWLIISPQSLALPITFIVPAPILPTLTPMPACLTRQISTKVLKRKNQLR
jgi:hypothetical protein